MQGAHKRSQLLNFAEESYLERTSRPVYALVFLVPFIVVYELGTIFINTTILKQYWRGPVVAFVWVQQLLEWIGFAGKSAWIATPLVVVVILIALQVTSGSRWRFRWGDYVPMLVECVALAVPLIVLGLLFNSRITPRGGSEIAAPPPARAVMVQATEQPAQETPGGKDDGSRPTLLLADIVTGIGAGIYEELAFRLVLIIVLMLLFQDLLRLGRNSAIVLSVLVSAGLFSAYHHVDFLSGRLYLTVPFNWAEFVFRTLAGVYFAVLFAVRGFGITAGTHALYDIMAAVINVVFFGRGN